MQPDHASATTSRQTTLPNQRFVRLAVHLCTLRPPTPGPHQQPYALPSVSRHQFHRPSASISSSAPLMRRRYSARTSKGQWNSKVFFGGFRVTGAFERVAVSAVANSGGLRYVKTARHWIPLRYLLFQLSAKSRLHRT